MRPINKQLVLKYVFSRLHQTRKKPLCWWERYKVVLWACESMMIEFGFKLGEKFKPRDLLLSGLNSLRACKCHWYRGRFGGQSSEELFWTLFASHNNSTDRNSLKLLESWRQRIRSASQMIDTRGWNLFKILQVLEMIQSSTNLDKKINKVVASWLIAFYTKLFITDRSVASGKGPQSTISFA